MPEDRQQSEDRERKADDRRGSVDPTTNPIPSSPEPDEEAVQKGEEILGRVKPY